MKPSTDGLQLARWFHVWVAPGVSLVDYYGATRSWLQPLAKTMEPVREAARRTGLSGRKGRLGMSDPAQGIPRTRAPGWSGRSELSQEARYCRKRVHELRAMAKTIADGDGRSGVLAAAASYARLARAVEANLGR